ncbi:MAG TPA: hypothetical protein VGW38_26075 [Chloroflexota bacterium]|nr:hypothetical protein [Chloroflexota bacterium]
MRHHAAIALLLCIILAVAAAVPAAAGGWAVTALDRLPTEIRAGEPYQIGYTILQHGQTPFSSRDTGVRIRTSSGEEHVFQARREGAPGHYVAEVAFPEAGTWTWEITHEFGPHTLPSVSVLPAQELSSVHQ